MLEIFLGFERLGTNFAFEKSDRNTQQCRLTMWRLQKDLSSSRGLLPAGVRGLMAARRAASRAARAQLSTGCRAAPAGRNGQTIAAVASGVRNGHEINRLSPSSSSSPMNCRVKWQNLRHFQTDFLLNDSEESFLRNARGPNSVPHNQLSVLSCRRLARGRQGK